MSYRHTLFAALESLHEVEDLVKTFPSDGNIPAMDIDLALQKLRNLYELMLHLRKESGEPEPEVLVSASNPPAGLNDEKEAGLSGKPSQVITLADKFQAKKTLHESLLPKALPDDDTLAASKPVDDLVSAVGINDRYTFIRELFKNDALAYEKAMVALNNATSFNDAYNYMMQHFIWDMNSEPVQQLLNLIRRKFIRGRHE